MRQDTVADYAGRTIAVIGLATPNFWLGIMVMIFPAIWWGWSPPMEWVPFAKDPASNIAAQGRHRQLRGRRLNSLSVCDIPPGAPLGRVGSLMCYDIVSMRLARSV